jgi:hypothetical protein
MDKKLLKEIESFKLMVDYDPSKVLSEQKVKTLNLGFDVDGQKKTRLWGKHGSDFGAGITASYYQEVDVNLETAQDILNKMNEELSGDIYNQIPNNIKRQLSEGYFESLITASNSQYLKDLSRKKKRDFRKFFLKSQRWQFKIGDLGGEYNSIIDINLPTNKDNMTLDSVKKNTESLLNQINELNASSANILSNQCNALIGKEEKVSGVKILTAESTAYNKEPLSTVFVFTDKPPVEYVVSPESTSRTSNEVVVDIPKMETNFSAGVSKDENFARKVVDLIYEELMEKEFSIEGMTKTGKQIVDERESGNLTSGIYLDFIETTSSASNTWTGEDVLDYTHENNGKEVKKIEELDKKGNNQKNIKLAYDRNTFLTSAVISGLRKKPGILSGERSTSVDYVQNVRVTNTDGLLDVDAKKKGLKPGQYAGFTLKFSSVLYVTKVKEEKTKAKSQLTQKLITLEWVGKKGGDLDVDISIRWSPGEKNKLLYRPLVDIKWIAATLRGDSLKGGYGDPRAAPEWWSKMRGYK